MLFKKSKDIFKGSIAIVVQ